MDRLRFGKKVDPSEAKGKENETMVFLRILISKETEDSKPSLLIPVYSLRKKQRHRSCRKILAHSFH